MPTSYKILGQTLPTQNVLSNVYVVPAATSAILNTITICNQSSANANVEIVIRPINETLANKHYILENVLIPRADTLIFSPGITLNASVIVAVNNSSVAGESNAALSGSNVSFSVFGVEIT
jgi:hypothetical protein